LFAALAIAGCGGGGGKVSAASLRSRLLPATAIPGFGLQRTLDWSDPVNLVGEGLRIPQRTRPREALSEFSGADFKGAVGEVLSSGPNGTEVTIGVAKFSSEADANRVRDWMHREDLRQPCFSQCIFSPAAVTVAGSPGLRLVVQSSPPPPRPPGAPRGVKFVAPAPANYHAEFTVGPYLYWASLTADSTAKTRFEEGMKLYYAHAKQAT
jgi:hypothetical protein